MSKCHIVGNLMPWLINNTNSSTGEDVGEEEEDLDTITTIVVPAVCAVIVLASLILVFFVCR